jgi:hypothetical protein
MANTAYLRYTVEPWVREHLAVRFGQPFSSEVLGLSPSGRHEFDAVSADRQIVVSIKTNSGLTSGGNKPTGKIMTCLAELYYLSLVDAPTRILLLTNPEFHGIFVAELRGAVAEGIAIELLALPTEMQVEVDKVTSRASREMTKEKVAEAVIDAAEESLSSEDPAIS